MMPTVLAFDVFRNRRRLEIGRHARSRRAMRLIDQRGGVVMLRRRQLPLPRG